MAGRPVLLRRGTARWTALLLAGGSALSAGVAAAIVVNEVMSNAPGADGGAGSPGDRLEYVELFNEDDRDGIDLAGWTIDDGDAVDEIRAWEGGEPGAGVTGTTRVGPGAFAIILDPEYDGRAADAYAGIPDDAVLLTVGNTTLGDGLSAHDPVRLLRPDGSVASTFGTPDREDDFPFDPGDGIAWERTDPTGADAPENWMPSRDGSGSTPGRRNSRSLPRNLSLADSSLIALPDPPPAGIPFELRGTVRNTGLEAVDAFGVDLFLDVDADGLPGAGEVRSQVVVAGPLAPGAAEEVSGPLVVEATGYVAVGMRVTVADDAEPADDVALREVLVGSASPRIVLNEIYNRPGAGEVEWLELYNRAAAQVDLEGWMVSDGGTAGRLAGDSLRLAPGAYAVICGDVDGLAADRPDRAGALTVEISPFPALGNRTDTVTIVSPGGYLSDRVGYDDAWGGATGVSLERVHPDDPGPGPTNWGSCVDAAGATPGRENSISQAAAGGEARISIEPGIFSPDGDGDADRAVIRYGLPASRARVRLRIYDVAGRRIRGLLDVSEGSGEGVVVWDGRDDGGRLLPIGIYVVALEAVDPFGGRLYREKATVVIGGRL